MQRVPRWSIHLALVVICFFMLIPFYWVLKTSVAGENIFAYPPSLVPKDPHPFYFIDVWYDIPFARFFLNSVVVVTIVIVLNLVFNAMAGYALTRDFAGKKAILFVLLSCMMIPFQATIIPAYLITAKMGLLNTYLGLALPEVSHIICILVFKANFEAVPKSLVEAARIDGVPEWKIVYKIMLPLSKPAIATNIVFSFVWTWNHFLWPLIIISDQDMQTLPLGLSYFLSYFEDTTGALYAFCVMVLAPTVFVFLMVQRQFIQGLTSGSTKG
ncbi:MAG: carbohydrate ABC transporter permease [Hyphomicrobiales bacterium]|nr:carbohydrate ABC transporter permease [Hyphomicrobiales bacterium]